MGGNSFGRIFCFTSFGESHGKAVGGIIDGCPAGIRVDYEMIDRDLARRKPVESVFNSLRKEDEKVEFYSGIFEDVTLGTPIAFSIANKDHRPEDYDELKDIYRPSHADYTYMMKYGIRDHRGGGRASARETAARVVAGAFAKMILRKAKISISAYVSQIGPISLEKTYSKLDLSLIDSTSVRCPDALIAQRMFDYLEEVRKEDDSTGGIVSCVVKNVPPGLGEPVFDKLHAVLGHAMLSINGAKGFDIGSGFECAGMRGSEHNDLFYSVDSIVHTRTNHSGGIQGGISNGEDIYFKVAFKPVPTIMKPQETLNMNLEKVVFAGKGRHDICIVPRAVPIVEAMAAMVIADFLLSEKTYS
ncbi:MAG: chorismate synthase [Bacteroidia bacterium]|nr:chorismate synthase [Bacteroidia bacterium]